MDLILKLIMENLDKVVEWVIIGVLFLIFKGKPSVNVIEHAKGVGVAIQELILTIMAEVSQDHVKVNEKLKVPVNISVIKDVDLQRHEVAKQAIIELNNSKIDKIADKLGGYDNLISIVYKSGKWLLKALKKGK